MVLLYLEALLALLILIGIVWWTMFSGRRKGELPRDELDTPAPQSPAEGRGHGQAQGQEGPPRA